jgi:hypothetical protein
MLHQENASSCTTRHGIDEPSVPRGVLLRLRGRTHRLLLFRRPAIAALPASQCRRETRGRFQSRLRDHGGGHCAVILPSEGRRDVSRFSSPISSLVKPNSASTSSVCEQQRPPAAKASVRARTALFALLAARQIFIEGIGPAGWSSASSTRSLVIDLSARNHLEPVKLFIAFLPPVRFDQTDYDIHAIVASGLSAPRSPYDL